MATGLWVAYCIEYDLDAQGKTVAVSWDRLTDMCNCYLDWCLENGQAELRPDFNMASFFELAAKKLLDTRELSWPGLSLEGYLLVN